MSASPCFQRGLQKLENGIAAHLLRETIVNAGTMLSVGLDKTISLAYLLAHAFEQKLTIQA